MAGPRRIRTLGLGLSALVAGIALVVVAAVVIVREARESHRFSSDGRPIGMVTGFWATGSDPRGERVTLHWSPPRGADGKPRRVSGYRVRWEVNGTLMHGGPTHVEEPQLTIRGPRPQDLVTAYVRAIEPSGRVGPFAERVRTIDGQWLDECTPDFQPPVDVCRDDGGTGDAQDDVAVELVPG